MTTHYHGDHFGAMAELTTRIPVRHFIDHGPSVEPAADAFSRRSIRSSTQGQAHRGEARGSDRRCKGSSARLSPRRVTLSAPCRRRTPESALRGLQASSGGCNRERAVGRHHVTFGSFRTLHLGDLTWNKEFDLMCPTTGSARSICSSCRTMGRRSPTPGARARDRPRVACQQRHAQRRPARRDEVIVTAPGLEDLWQLHSFQLSGQEYTVPGTSSPTPDEPRRRCRSRA